MSPGVWRECHGGAPGLPAEVVGGRPARRSAAEVVGKVVEVDEVVRWAKVCPGDRRLPPRGPESAAEVVGGLPGGEDAAARR